MNDFVDKTYQRVEQLIIDNKLNIKTFEETIQVSNNSIGTAIRRKASFKSNVLNKILIAFPEINPTWLLTGKGKKYVESETLNPATEPELIYELEDLKAEVKTELLKLLLNDTDIKDAISNQVETALKK